MIKHVVLFKFKSSIAEVDKKQKTYTIQDGLLALKEKIEELKSIEVGINSNPKETYDLALITTFDSYKHLHKYAVHPEHVKVSVMVREILEERACVDYEL